MTSFVSTHEVGLIDAEGGVMRDPVGGPTLNLASGGAGVPGQTFASWGEETSSALVFGLFCAFWELAHRPEDEGGLGRPIRRGGSLHEPDVMMGLNMSNLAYSIASHGCHVSGRPERLEQLAALNPPFVWSMPDAKAEEFEALIVAYVKEKGDAFDGKLPSGDGTRLGRMWDHANRNGQIVSGRPQLRERLRRLGVQSGPWSDYT